MAAEGNKGGRPRVTDRKPSEGKALISLRLDPERLAWVEANGKQEYIKRLIDEDRARSK